MSLIAGSYERFIWGFKLRPSEPQTLSLTPVFSYPSHLSAIRTLAAAGPVAASGGADDTIHLYDLSTASSLGSLHDHSASLTALSFYTPPNLSFPRNLVSAAADGSVCIYDADPFVHLKTVWPHRKAVNDLSIHPSGKLALTVGHDECLAMINLVRGRRSFYCRLGKEASLVNFDVGGDKFFMVIEEKVSVHEAEDARLLCEFENKKRVLCATPCENGILLTGGEDRCLTAWDVKSGKVAYSIEEAHAARVKGIVVLTNNSSGAFSDDDPHVVATASTDGVIRVWDVRMAIKDKPNPLAEANTKSRLTCLAGSALKSLRRPQIGKNASDEGQCGPNATDNNELADITPDHEHVPWSKELEIEKNGENCGSRISNNTESTALSPALLLLRKSKISVLNPLSLCSINLFSLPLTHHIDGFSASVIRTYQITLPFSSISPVRHLQFGRAPVADINSGPAFWCHIALKHKGK